jgi:hypothetical protein
MDISVILWSIYEINFTASEDYTNPFLKQDDPLLRVTFVHPDSGTRFVVEGFWDGGKTWRARFAPTLTGTWNWNSTSTDAGLDGKSGDFNCAAPTPAQIAENPNYRGHLKVHPTGRYFTYADGTPFFWIGDTNWSMNTRRCGLGSNSDGPFYTWLDDRKAKGFTVILSEYFEINQQNEGGYPFPTNTNGKGDHVDLNPNYFRSLDIRVQALWDSGFVLAAHPTWIGKQFPMSLADAKRVSRYLMARYGAYNIVWSLSGEYQYSYHNISPPWNTGDWNELGEAVQSCNTFGHPVSVHPSGRQNPKDPPEWPIEAHQGSSGGEFHDEAWLDHNWLQTGHAAERLWRVPFRVAENYAGIPAKPVVHSEGFYENHKRDGAGASQIRWQVWTAFLNGAAGHGYGGGGVWQFYDPSDPGGVGRDRRNSPPASGATWREALNYPGAGQIKHARDFFTSFDWWTLEPHRDWIRIDGAVPNTESLTDPHCAAKPGERYIIYIPEGNAGKTIDVHNLDNRAYKAQWFNPRDGSLSTINNGSSINAELGEEWSAPPMQDSDDWVLCLSLEPG